MLAGEIRHALIIGYYNSILGPICNDIDMHYANISGYTCGFAVIPSCQCENCFRTTSNLCQTGQHHLD